MLKLSGFWRNRNEEIAAIDLGSNSFHMIIAKVANGQITVVDRLKEPVRLGYGLTDDGVLDDLSQQRALACLERFHQRIKHFPRDCVRAVGTRTLRQANQVYAFLDKAERALGFDIQIIPGAEEARLVYQGVAFNLADDHDPRLVIDIGGGSTELIIGQDFAPITMESLGMGCVSLTKKFFEDGELTAKRMRQADIYCRQKLEPFEGHFRRQTWSRVIGCSGSIKSVSKVIEARTGHPAISRDALDDLVQQCIEAGSIEALSLTGLSNQRQPVFVGGLLVLRACLKALRIDSLEASPWALREGLLYDLLGHGEMHDMRERSVMELAKRFHADEHHAQQTCSVAERLYQATELDWTDNLEGQQYLRWAAWLQEVGLDINHDKFHVHSGYIVEHSHLAGFGYDEQNRLAFLVRNQRKKPDWARFETMPDDEKPALLVLLHLFRLACVLTRARNDVQHIGWSLHFENNTLTFTAPDAWWEQQPLAAADLETEQHLMKKSAIEFVLRHPEARD